MCTNQKRVYNKYTHKSMYVNCGHCPSCLQQNAAYRVQRIKNNDREGMQCYMLTLTYARHNAPYILRSDAYKFSKGELDTLNVYRDTRYRWKRYGSGYDYACFGIKETHVLSSIEFSDDVCSIFGVKDLAHEFNHIGVCYYPDLQKFFARLRLNLKRNFNYEESFSAYSTSEYGCVSYRPHFHILLWIRKADFQVFRAAIGKSWPFSNILLWDRTFEEAKRAASYVASYVNSGSHFPRFLQNVFPPKHSYSKGFGMGNKLFSLPTLLSKFRNGHITYFSQKVRNGIPCVVECLYPKYVISRYFPLVKGYGRFVGTAQCYYLSGFVKCAEEYEKYYKDGYYKTLMDIQFGSFAEHWNFISRNGYQMHTLQYDVGEIYRIGVRLRNAFNRFLGLSGLDIDLWNYLLLYQKVWNLYRSDCLRLHLQNEEVPLNEKYDNLDEVKETFEHDGVLPIGFSSDMLMVVDPNRFQSVQNVTFMYQSSFYEFHKHKSVANAVMSSDIEEF